MPIYYKHMPNNINTCPYTYKHMPNIIHTCPYTYKHMPIFTPSSISLSLSYSQIATLSLSEPAVIAAPALWFVLIPLVKGLNVLAPKCSLIMLYI